MDEKLKNAKKRVVEFWQKYDKKQKTPIFFRRSAFLVGEGGFEPPKR